MLQEHVFRLAFVSLLAAFAVAGLSGCGNSQAQPQRAAVQNVAAPAQTPRSDAADDGGKGMAALRRAAADRKYLFAFFSKSDDERTTAMRAVFDGAMAKVASRAQSVAVNVSDESENAIIKKFDLSRSPMPLVLAIAPNGAVTGGFSTKFEEQQLLDAFATPAAEKVMKGIQDGKLVFVCVQNAATKSNAAALRGIRDFMADARFCNATELITLDPADKNEATFLTDLKVPADTTESTTVFVVPPGKAIAKIEGATDKDALLEVMNGAGAGACGPGGCGPGGCGPSK